MKKSLLWILLMGLMIGAAPATQPKVNPNVKGTITLSGAWALYPMAVKWAGEFKKIYPNIRIDISAGGAGKGVADALAGVVDLGMVSRDLNPAEIKKGAWYVAVTKDAVVPVVSAGNPKIKELLASGVKKETLIGIWITRAVKDFHVYTRSDACGAAETWAKYLGKKQEDLEGIGVYGDPGLANAVQKDTLGIGYNNVNFAYDPKAKKPLAGLCVLPIDLNGNGKLDKDENFYDTRDTLTKAIADGKYPSPPARELFFACKGKPEKPQVIEFLRWVLTDGQKFAPETGYIRLGDNKIKEHLKKLEAK